MRPARGGGNADHLAAPARIFQHCTAGYAGPGDRLGTKKDVQDQLQLLQTASAEMKKLAQDGKCWDAAEKEFKRVPHCQTLDGGNESALNRGSTSKAEQGEW